MIKTSASARRIGLYDKRGKATHEWTIVYDTIHRSYVEGKLSKSTILTPPLFGDPIATKSGETHVRDRNLSCKF